MQTRFLPIAVCVTALGVLAACGSDDSGSPVTTGPITSGPVTTGPVTTVATLGSTVASGQPEGVVSYAGLSQDHTSDDVTYEQNPPVGGPHDASPQSCGFYDTRIPTERGVHSMEHGAVWITYAPDLAPDQMKVLKTMVAGHTHLLVSPYDGLPSPVVASAWGEQLVLASASDPRLAQFVAFFEEGPQTPELGAPC